MRLCQRAPECACTAVTSRLAQTSGHSTQTTGAHTNTMLTHTHIHLLPSHRRSLIRVHACIYIIRSHLICVCGFLALICVPLTSHIHFLNFFFYKIRGWYQPLSPLCWMILPRNASSKLLKHRCGRDSPKKCLKMCFDSKRNDVI